MPKKDRIYMPSGAGGLLRYGEEGKAVIKLKPEHVVYIVVAAVVLEIILKIVF